MRSIYEGQPERLDKVLGLMLADMTRTYIQKQIKEGAVTVNQKQAKPSQIVVAGDQIDCEIAPVKEPDILPKEIPLDILYEDESLLVINKPKGMVVHPAPGHYDDTLVNALMAYCKEDLSGIGGVARPGIVHRIDKDTSGSLLVCKTDAAHQGIAAQLKEHSIRRIYTGIVCGNLRQPEGVIHAPIARHPKDRKRMATAAPGKGKDAITHYRQLETFKGYSHMEFKLETGRTHQIRVHMASIHHPLVGDELYKAPKNKFGIEGHLLHAKSLEFEHPVTHIMVYVEAPYPDEYLRVLEKLRRTQL